MWAGIRTVTRADGNDQAINPGSFRYEIEHMEDGDTLLFDDALATAVIRVNSTLAIGSQAGSADKSYTVIGNGVALTTGSGSYTLSFGSYTAPPARITVENLCFKDYYTVTFSGKLNRIANSRFTVSSEAAKPFYIYVDKSDRTFFEGCAFVSGKDYFSHTLRICSSRTTATAEQQAQKVDFVSCTFVRLFETNYPFVSWTNTDAANTKSFTNCILIDKSGPNAVPLIRIPASNFVSNGYNVIQGLVDNGAEEIVPAWKKPTDLYLKPATAFDILACQDDNYRVAVAGGKGLAYRHLPAYPNAAPGLETVNFPGKDLSGATIDYTQPTHSGARQETDGADVPAVTAPTDIRIFADVTEIFSETELWLSAIVWPVCFEPEIQWSSSDESVVTVGKNGKVTALPAAAAGNRTVTITAAHGSLRQSVDLTVKPYMHVEEIKLDAGRLSVPLMHSMQLTASITPAVVNNPTLTWTITPADVATLVVSGQTATLKGVKEGEATVTVVSADGNRTASCTVEVFKQRVHVVTNASASENTEGSFLFEIRQMASGDTLTFDASLAGDTLPVTLSSYADLFTSQQNGCDIIVIGNGVTLPAFNWGYDRARYVPSRLVLENLRFDVTGDIHINASFIHLKRCLFENTGTKLYWIRFSTNSLLTTVESCSFLGTHAPCVISQDKGYNGNNIAQFISCTFVNLVKGDRDMNHIHNIGSELVFANCVLIDKGNPDMNTPSIYLQAGTLTSKGSNVIQGIVNGYGTAKWNELTDTIVPLDAETPLAVIDGIYKVRVGTAGNHGAAYRRLPANPAGLQDFAGLSFPEKDLSGNTIHYALPTHSGAWQAIDGEDLPFESVATGISIAAGQTELFSETEQQLSATVLPTTVDQKAVWSSSDENIATVDETGKVTFKAADSKVNQTVDITAASVALNASGQPVRQTVTFTVKPYIHVESVRLDAATLPLYLSYTGKLTASFLPANVNNAALIWSVSPEGIVGLSASDSTVEVRALALGEATVTATSADGNQTASCLVTVKTLDYTQGAFLVNEDWFGHRPGSVNFLTNEGEWIFDVVKNENPGRKLGITSQFGAIYGDRFYITSKQDGNGGSRLAVLNAQTMKMEKEFAHIVTGSNGESAGDGRAFLGVDEHKGYVGTSNGIYVLDIDRMTLAPSAIPGSEGADPKNLYDTQVGNMVRVGEQVFAVHQSKGLLVIDANDDIIRTVIAAPKNGTKQLQFASIVQSKDGNLWLSVVSQSYLVKVDPWTLDTVHVGLPEGWAGPQSFWGAWTPDPFCSDPNENVLYWSPSGVKGGILTTGSIVRYDIDTQQFDVIFDGKEWNIYSGGYRVDPVSGNLHVIMNRTGYTSETLGILNPRTKELKLYPLNGQYWFPSIPVFSDNYEPETTEAFPSTVTLNDTYPAYSLWLGDLVTDRDNPDAGIIKTVSDGYDASLISARIWRDSLIIVPAKNIPAGSPAESTTLALKFNSNGKVITRSVNVTLESGISGITINPFELTQHTLWLYPGEIFSLELTAPQHFRVIWLSRDPSVASVDSRTGQVYACKAGTTRIIVSDVETGQSDACIVLVRPHVPETGYVKLNTSLLTLMQGERSTLQFIASSGLANQTPVWSVSDQAVADVTPTGRVIAIAPGVCTIRVAIGPYEATCTVTVAAWTDEITVDRIQEQEARLIFSKVTGASYYLVHLYEKKDTALLPVRTYKVMNDGSTSLLRAAMGDHFMVMMNDLVAGARYTVTIETLLETGRKAEVIHTKETAFATKGSSPTGSEKVTAGPAQVWYAGGTLHFMNLDGYDCTLFNFSGQGLQKFRISSPVESRSLRLPSGVYILTAQKSDDMETFKFIIK
jgi:uncharacterized protein YjdB